jgi:ribosomal protein S27E
MMDCSVSSSWREYSGAVAKQPHDDATMGKLVRLRDLIVDVYIDPVTERHMNLYSSSSKTSDTPNLQQVMLSFQCADAKRMESKQPTGRDSKRRNPTTSTALEGHRAFGKKKISSRHLLSKLERAERLEWTHSQRSVRTKPVRNFVRYPKEQDVEQAAGRALSQLLASWSPPPPAIGHPTVPWEGPPLVEDVEQTLLRCRFSSGGLKKKKNEPTLPLRPFSQPESRSPRPHRPTPLSGMVAPEKTLMEIDAFSSDSSSMSSLSFPELRQALPPALLRVSTSTILEQQDLIWSQIQQDRQKEEEAAAPRRRHRPVSTWNPEEEVTRSHTRPPLSPPRRLHHHSSSSFQTPPQSSNRSFRTPEGHSLSRWTVPLASSPISASCSPMKNRSPSTPARISLSSSAGSSASARTTEIDTGDHVPVPALCGVCQASWTVFPASTTVVYCAQCGIATDLLRSLRTGGAGIHGTIKHWE